VLRVRFLTFSDRALNSPEEYPPPHHCFCKSAQEVENKRVAAFSVCLVCAKSAQAIENKRDELSLFGKRVKEECGSD